MSDALTTKGQERATRMRVSNALEEKVLTEWQKKSMKACDDAVRKYWLCRQDAGMAVVFKCHAENDELHQCLRRFNEDKAQFETFRKQRTDELVKSHEAFKLRGGAMSQDERAKAVLQMDQWQPRSARLRAAAGGGGGGGGGRD